MSLKTKLSVKEFTSLVGHHSEGNIRVFRERLRLHNVIKNNEPLTEDLVAVWEEICKVHEKGYPWVEAMDHVINQHNKQTNEISDTGTRITESTNNGEKLDEVIYLLKEILGELRRN